MKIQQFVPVAAAMLWSLPANAYVGTCIGSERNVTLSITTDDRGQITDMLLRVPGAAPTRYPEANASLVILSSYSLAFSAKATANHEAMDLHIAGKLGRLRLGGDSINLECEWM